MAGTGGLARFGGVGRALLLPVTLVATLTGPGHTSDVPAARERLAGHPKARFPLGVYLASVPDPGLEEILQAAVIAWNRVSAETLGVAVLRWQEQREGADVILRFRRDASPHLMGLTELDADAQGVIQLPVEITLIEPVARGQTPSEQVLFQVAAHELGHALGLPHLNEPGSLMCCDVGALDFKDPATRDAYVAARRDPDVGSVSPQLGAHYRRFWGR